MFLRGYEHLIYLKQLQRCLNTLESDPVLTVVIVQGLYQ